MTFEYSIAAIPTMYKSIQFRSRLEARWAAFFDIVGWKWSYEPLDFNGWIPDFIIHGKKERILVEVKPIFEFTEEFGYELSRQAIGGRSNDDILVLGAALPEHKYWHGLGFGWLGEYMSGDLGHAWGTAGVHTGGDGPIGFCHDTMDFRNRITGYYSGDDGVECGNYDAFLKGAWAGAGNTVQWIAKRAA